MAELQLDDGTLWYQDIGSGAPVVFVHGGWMDGDAWRTQLEHFADEYRAITLDVRGHGRTGATDARRYSIDLFVDDLERLLAHLEVDRPVVCGLSLGSMVAQAYLHRHPEAVAGAVFSGPIQSMPPVDVPAVVKPFVSPMPALEASLSLKGSRATFRSLLHAARATNGGPWLSIDPSTRSRVIDDVGGVPRDEFRKIFGALYRFDPPTLEGVSTPTLAVYGDRESPLVKRHGRRIAADVDDGEWTELRDAGHLVNQDNPTAFNRALGEFLAGVGRAS